MKIFNAIFFLFFLNIVFCQAQITIEVSCDKNDWNYKLGEKVTYSYEVKGLAELSDSLNLTYQIGEEKMPASNKGKLRQLKGTLEGGTMTKPGFLQCIIRANYNKKSIKGLATAGFEVENIQPTAVMPSDFLDFWNKAISKAKTVPLLPKMIERKELSNEKVKVYSISFQNETKDSRIYGILTIPNKEGRFPAVLDVPGAGIRSYKPDLELMDHDIITLQIGIHGIPVESENELYVSLANGALQGYPFINLDSKDHYYYKRVYLGCIKAVDFIFDLEQFDGSRIAVSGGSQGGALAIVTAALDPRIKYVRSFYPALSDHTGYLHNRAGGWPHLLNENNFKRNNLPDKIETLGYYDVVNFAKLIKVPGFYSWGYNDEVCPPTSMYASYNVITAPKELMIVKETGHVTSPIQLEAKKKWLIKMLKQ